MSKHSLYSKAGIAPQAQKLPNLMKDATYGGANDIMALPAGKAVAIVENANASTYARAKACQRLAVIGGGRAVRAVAPLLTDPQLSHYARTALETNPDTTANDALRGALPKVKGTLLVGVINSIGTRRDTEAIAALEKLRHDSDVEVVLAADAALARIRPPL
jgi:hypothetical protein